MAAALPAAGNAAPTTNFTGDAGQNIDAAKFQALQSIAQSGSQAQAGLALAGQQQAAQRTQALKDAMAFSAARGGGVGAVNAPVQANTQATVAAPFDARTAALNMIRQNYAQDNAATAQANSGYFDLTKAGLPIANAALQQTIANDRVTQADNALKEQAAIADAQAKLAAAQPGGATATKNAISALGGAGTAGTAINNIANQENVTGTDANGYSARTGGVGSGMVGTPATVAGEVGLPTSVAQALAGAANTKSAAAAQTATSRQAAITKAQAANTGNSNYTKYLNPALDALGGTNGAAKQTPQQLTQTLVAGGVDATTASKIVKDAAAILNTTTP